MFICCQWETRPPAPRRMACSSSATRGQSASGMSGCQKWMVARRLVARRPRLARRPSLVPHHQRRPAPGGQGRRLDMLRGGTPGDLRRSIDLHRHLEGCDANPKRGDLGLEVLALAPHAVEDVPADRGAGDRRHRRDDGCRIPHSAAQPWKLLGARRRGNFTLDSSNRASVLVGSIQHYCLRSFWPGLRRWPPVIRSLPLPARVGHRGTRDGLLLLRAVRHHTGPGRHRSVRVHDQVDGHVRERQGLLRAGGRVERDWEPRRIAAREFAVGARRRRRAAAAAVAGAREPRAS